MTAGVEEAEVAPAYTMVAFVAPAAVYTEADWIADTAAGKVQGQPWREQKRKEKTTLFGVNLMRNQVFYRAAQCQCLMSFAERHEQCTELRGFKREQRASNTLT